VGRQEACFPPSPVFFVLVLVNRVWGGGGGGGQPFTPVVGQPGLVSVSE